MGQMGETIETSRGSCVVAYWIWEPPEALNNYLLRLGWSHDEIISEDQLSAVRCDVGRAASRFDMDKP